METISNELKRHVMSKVKELLKGTSLKATSRKQDSCGLIITIKGDEPITDEFLETIEKSLYKATLNDEFVNYIIVERG